MTVAQRNSDLISKKLMYPSILWPDLAEAFDISVSMAQRIWRDHNEQVKQAFSSEMRDPLLVVANKIRAYEDIRMALAIMAKDPNTHASVKLGCYKAIIDTHKEDFKMLIETELIPKGMGTVARQRDSKLVAKALLDLFEKYVPMRHLSKAKLDLVDVMTGKDPALREIEPRGEHPDVVIAKKK